jgi:hypothetical protein
LRQFLKAILGYAAGEQASANFFQAVEDICSALGTTLALPMVGRPLGIHALGGKNSFEPHNTANLLNALGRDSLFGPADTIKLGSELTSLSRRPGFTCATGALYRGCGLWAFNFHAKPLSNWVRVTTGRILMAYTIEVKILTPQHSKGPDKKAPDEFCGHRSILHHTPRRCNRQKLPPSPACSAVGRGAYSVISENIHILQWVIRVMLVARFSHLEVTEDYVHAGPGLPV